jgi:hypothetical protein
MKPLSFPLGPDQGTRIGVHALHPDVPVEPQFPAGPNIGEQFVRPDGVYRWDGARWLSLAEWALRSDPPVEPQEATE